MDEDEGKDHVINDQNELMNTSKITLEDEIDRRMLEDKLRTTPSLTKDEETEMVESKSGLSSSTDVTVGDQNIQNIQMNEDENKSMEPVCNMQHHEEWYVSATSHNVN